MTTSDKRLERITSSLTCPVSWEPLFGAVSLIPCAHKINETVALEMFGTRMKSSWRTTKAANCPICTKVVLGYSDDHTIRNITKDFFGDGQSEESTLTLPEAPIQIEAEEEPSFPGARGRFMPTSGNWLTDSQTDSLRKYRVFLSLTDDSAFKELRIVGYEDHSIQLSITPRLTRYLPCPALEKYMSQVGFPLNGSHTFRSYNVEESKRLFEIFTKNNDLPKPHLSELRQIVKNGRWD